MCTQFVLPPVLISSLVCLLRPWAPTAWQEGCGDWAVSREKKGRRSHLDHRVGESRSRRRGPTGTQLSESLPLHPTHTHTQRVTPCTLPHSIVHPAAPTAIQLPSQLLKTLRVALIFNSHSGVGGQTSGTITLIPPAVSQACNNRMHDNASCENVTLTRRVYACLKFFRSI